MTMMELLGMMIQAEENGDAFVDFDVEDASISLTINDFEGFNEDWSEVMHDFADADLVEAIEDALDEMADSTEGDFYVYYHFAQWTVCLGYTSYDI